MAMPSAAVCFGPGPVSLPDRVHKCSCACPSIQLVKHAAFRARDAACRASDPGRGSCQQVQRPTARSQLCSALTFAAATSPDTVQVRFRKVDTFNLWIWLELAKAPTAKTRELLSYIFESWYMLGRLGGFNSQNLQILEAREESVTKLKYDHSKLDEAGTAFFHELGQLEARERWCRIWINMGTGDEFALDILVNALETFSREEATIRQLVIGGVNKDWPVPKRTDPNLEGMPEGIDPQDL